MAHFAFYHALAFLQCPIELGFDIGHCESSGDDADHAARKRAAEKSSHNKNTPLMIVFVEIG